MKIVNFEINGYYCGKSAGARFLIYLNVFYGKI